MNLEDKDFRRYQKQIGELEARIRELEKERDEAKHDENVVWAEGEVNRRDVEALRTRVAELQKERDDLSSKVVDARSAWIKEQKENAQLRTTVSTLENALRLILPMAKGYASEHPVGSNQEYVEEAERALSGKTGEGLQADIEEATHALMEIQAESQQKTEEKIALRARVKELEGGRRDVWREVVGVLARARDLEPDAGTKALISALLSRARKEVGENVT
jgi:chromosome segregation ATPase